MLASIPRPLSQALLAGQVVPFVGAGVSRAVRHCDTDKPLFPNWRELLELGADAIDQDKPDDAQLVRSYLQIREPKYLEAAQHLREQMRGSQWASWLRKHIDPPHNSINEQDLMLARLLWNLGSNLIITTNYDRVLHWACPASNNLQRLGNSSVAEFAEILQANGPSRPTLWHIHGHIDNVNSMILTPDSYQRFYANHADQDELVREESAALETLRGLMASRTLLFIGYSLDDAYLGMHLSAVFRLFRGFAGDHYTLIHRNEADRVRTLGLPVEPVVFGNFGEPMREILESLGTLARGDAPSRPPSAPDLSTSTKSTPPPPGGRYQPAWYIDRPHVEENALRRLNFVEPVLLWGSRKQGCTWVSQHAAQSWQREVPDNRHVTVVDFRDFGLNSLQSLDTCLRKLAIVVADHLLDEADDPTHKWETGPGSPKTRLSNFIKTRVLDNIPGEHLLVFEHANRIHRQPYFEDVTGLLRSWAEKARERVPWNRLRLMVSVSTHPTRLRTARHESPFAGLSDPIHVGDLAHRQVKQLVHRYDSSWADAEIDQLMAVVGGHAYLICIVLVDMLDRRYTLEQLSAGTPLGSSLMSDHLRWHREDLDTKPLLSDAFHSLARDSHMIMDRDVRDELIRMGLIIQHAAGNYGLRYPVYKRLLV